MAFESNWGPCCVMVGDRVLQLQQEECLIITMSTLLELLQLILVSDEENFQSTSRQYVAIILMTYSCYISYLLHRGQTNNICKRLKFGHS